MKLKTFIFSIFLICGMNIFAASTDFNFDNIFNQKLTQAERDTLSTGEVLIRNTKNSSNIALKSFDEQSSALINIFNKFKPVYLAEIIQIIPEDSKPDLINKLTSALSDIPSYKGIPYYSEHNDIWVDLYSEASIKSQSQNGNVQNIDAHFFMDPFGNIESEIQTKSDSNAIYYTNENTSNIEYRNITCIKPQNMKSHIYVFKKDGYWILYGIGGVKAPKVPFVSERIELSFMNRIKTFCKFIFEKIE